MGLPANKINMGYWAKIDDNNVVEWVIEADADYIQSGAVGDPSKWLETSITGEIRKNYAGIGYTYSAPLNCFYAPEPSGSTGFDDSTCKWILPAPSGSI